MFDVIFYRKCITIITISIAWTGIMVFTLFVEKYIHSLYQHTTFDIVDFFKECTPLLFFLSVLNTILPFLTVVHYRKIIKEQKRIFDHKITKAKIPHNTTK